MTESSSWKIRARMREFESGEAPREVTFCLDPTEQAEYRSRWLEGDEIGDIRRDIEARKAKAQDALREPPETDQPQSQADKWRKDIYGDSGPRYD